MSIGKMLKKAQQAQASGTIGGSAVNPVVNERLNEVIDGRGSGIDFSKHTSSILPNDLPSFPLPSSEGDSKYDENKYSKVFIIAIVLVLLGVAYFMFKKK